MKTIGLLGGMSFESTALYYNIINTTVKKHLGGLNSAKILLYSVNFAEIEACQINNDWEKSANILSAQAKKLEQAGADFVALCTNTMHKIAPQIIQEINIPFVHIADTTIDAIKKENISKVALLGTKYTMEQDFYKQKFLDQEIEIIIPNYNDREIISDVIYTELCLGIVKHESKQKYIKIIEKLEIQGIQGVILGCTEISLLISEKDISVPVFDTTVIHAEKLAFLSMYNLRQTYDT